MRTIKEWSDRILDAERLPQSATRAEIVDGLDIVAQAMMEGKATMAHADALLSMRYSLMSAGERGSEEKTLSTHLAELGAKGGQAKTPAKRAAAAANGAKGGRPKKADPE